MTGQAFDDRDIPGESKRSDIVLNRRAPYIPTGFDGGHNTRAGDWVEFDWSLNRERDVLGYRVVWAGRTRSPRPPTTSRSARRPPPARCSTRRPTAALTSAPRPACRSTSIVAVDRDASNTLRDGTKATLTVGAAGGPPRSPLLLVLTNVGGVPKLTWMGPLLEDVAFYRIYRDGTSVAYADRYDRTTGGLITTYTDSDPGTTSHRYWVTTVNSDYNESDPIGPVTWSP